MNILLIHSDQHRYDCIRAHGIRNDIQTPNLDRLCAEGTTFSRAYSTIPICTAARASLLTGAWPTAHGCFCIPTSELDRAARPELPTFLPLLQQAGYRTGWVGKYHRELPIEGDPGSAQGVDDFVPLWEYHKKLQVEGIASGSNAHGYFGDENCETPPEQACLAWQADHAIRILEESKGQPFFLRWDPPEPHLPCQPTSQFANLYDAETLEPWQSFPDPLEGKPSSQRRQKKIWGLEGWTWTQWQPTVRLYFGIISELDYHIGRVLAKLEALGRVEDTFIIYSTDHGDYCGGHGQMDKHFNMYEDVVHVPLLMRWPGQVPAGATCDAFSSNSIDIARTILAAAEIEAPESFVGEDLVRCARDADYRPRDVAYAQYFGTETGAYSCRMIRDDRYKFVYHPVGDCHEFYDLQTDPGELTNLIGDAGLTSSIHRLKVRLWDVMRENGDRLANSWTAIELKGTAPLGHKAHRVG